MNTANVLFPRTRVFTVVAIIVCACFAPGVDATDTDSVLPNGNTADGSGVLISLTTGVWNTGIGFEALSHDTSGGSNTAEGVRALFSNTNGNSNTATGVYALYSNSSGAFNTAVGTQALDFNVSGYRNTAVGSSALYRNTANENTAVGASALFSNTSGYDNNAFGVYALRDNTAGLFNSAFGALALRNNTTGSQNTAVGDQAMLVNTAGHSNTAIGYSALYLSTGDHNVALGNYAGEAVTTASNVIVIGSDFAGENVSNRCYIGNIYGVIASSGSPVYINANGQLGTGTSSRRFKDDIKPMNDASDSVLDLQPVTFRYKKDRDPAQVPQFGLVAEEVAKVNPDLVIRDKDGKPYTVRYEAVNAMLLNEFLKEHRKVQELEKQVENLTAGLQRVSEALEFKKQTPRVVANR